jgi:membrane protein DedA with SNARE-associated domain
MDGSEPPPERSKPDRRRLRILLALIVVLVATNALGDVLTAGLVESHPLWLLALNSRKRTVLLVAPHTDVIPFLVVAVLRQLLSDPLYYLLGRWYGDAGTRWLERKMGEGGSFVRLLESSFAKAAWPMVVILPNPIICMLAGASRMPPALFAALNLGGTIAAIAILRSVGDVFGGPISSVTDFLSEYRLPIMAISFVLVAANLTLNRKRGTSELESITEMERELDAEAAREREPD